MDAIIRVGTVRKRYHFLFDKAVLVEQSLSMACRQGVKEDAEDVRVSAC